MPPSKTPQSPESELADAVQMLAEEIRVLRDAVDELREQVAWANHNHCDESRSWVDPRMRSFSIDPTSPDFAVNTVDEATVEQVRSELTPNRSVSGEQGALFD